MQKTRAISKYFLICLLFLTIAGESYGQLFIFGEERLERRAGRKLSDADELFAPWSHLGKIDIDSLSLDRNASRIQLFFSPAITHIPIRYPWYKYIEAELTNMLGWRFRKYQVEMFARDMPLKEFIPNYFRYNFLDIDTLRIRSRDKVPPLVRKKGQQTYTGGFDGNHIALWHSHGYYFDAKNDRWQWQRARLFGSIEDLTTMEYVVGYIAPMLENAGANVLLPRERDIQTNEVVVDVDVSATDSELIINNGNHTWEYLNGGFAIRDTLFDGENPFRLGRHLVAASNSEATLHYIPNIPEAGYYAVYVSWADAGNNIPDALYEVNYPGGQAQFLVNQRMGHGTWIYLGQFFFKEGKNPEAGSVILYTDSEFEGLVTADAVRFGGGMGNVARILPDHIVRNRRSVTDNGSSATGQTVYSNIDDTTGRTLSESPRFAEGARYYLQYAGMPDTLVYSLNHGRNDYNDDYMSRGEWVNYLLGDPLGPLRNREVSGLGIPVDLSVSFHTDAGITQDDSVIGTLAIYSSQRDENVFPDGVSRLASRDLTDIIQDQLVSDIRAAVNPSWTRRAIWDRGYSEAWRPNVPALLLELYSHQNLADISYGFDPRFQFIASRAIYKGILRFIANQEGREAIVQPLPPSHMAINILNDKLIRISWQEVPDPLEPTANPDYFKVYTRIEEKGFDQGVIAADNYIEIELPEWGTVYSFKVTAINAGGESFPSETLSVALVPDQEKTVMIINGFDRISGPGTFDTGTMAGISWWDDMPIPHKFSVAYTGMQYDYNRESPWLDDDSPGWGASYADLEKKVIPGNSFDFPYIHGKAIRNAGYSFVSASRKALDENMLEPERFWALNIIMGKQKGMPAWINSDSIIFRAWDDALTSKLTEYAKNGGNILVTGAHIGTDMVQHKDTIAFDFAENYLGFTWRTNNATNTGDVLPTRHGQALGLPNTTFNIGWHPKIYTVEAPDAIEAHGNNSFTILRYASNKTSAAVVHQGEHHNAVSFGFPFEAIINENERNKIMKHILLYFENH